MPASPTVARARPKSCESVPRGGGFPAFADTQLGRERHRLLAPAVDLRRRCGHDVDVVGDRRLVGAVGERDGEALERKRVHPVLPCGLRGGRVRRGCACGSAFIDRGQQGEQPGRAVASAGDPDSAAAHRERPGSHRALARIDAAAVQRERVERRERGFGIGRRERDSVDREPDVSGHDARGSGARGGIEIEIAAQLGGTERETRTAARVGVVERYLVEPDLVQLDPPRLCDGGARVARLRPDARLRDPLGAALIGAGLIGDRNRAGRRGKHLQQACRSVAAEGDPDIAALERERRGVNRARPGVDASAFERERAELSPAGHRSPAS